MLRRSLLPVVLLSLRATPCLGQSPITAGARVQPLESFFRVADRLGEDRAAFAAHWPRTLPPRVGVTEFRLTAADRLVVHFDPTDPATAAVPRVHTVQLWRAVPDTLTLRRVVAEAQVALMSRYGAPSDCSDPLGPPAHLYAAQRVSRVWRTGPKGRPVRLSWSVTPQGSDVQLYAGADAAEPEATVSCSAALP